MITKQILAEIPHGIEPEAIVLMDEMNGMKIPTDTDVFAEEFKEFLQTRASEQTLDEKLKELKLETTEEMRATVDTYFMLRTKHPHMAFHNEFLPRVGSNVTDNTLFLIDNIVKKTRITDKYGIVDAVCKAIETKFGDNERRLNEGLSKMNLRTTNDILHAVDIYFIMRKLYPDAVFGRERAERFWADAV